jgi:hypothetical protein
MTKPVAIVYPSEMLTTLGVLTGIGVCKRNDVPRARFREVERYDLCPFRLGLKREIAACGAHVERTLSGEVKMTKIRVKSAP